MATSTAAGGGGGGVAEPISIVEHASSPSNSALFGTSLSSSAGRHRRPTTIKQRRLSSSTHAAAARSPHGTAAYSLPATHAYPSPSTSATLLPQMMRARSSSVIGGEHDQQLDDGEIKPGSSKKHRGETYICEKCNKHWKEASKLLLSKHQQVQLLEAAAILKAASSGASLPDEKSFWPAAVSPPSSGLLGSDVLNINTLTSPRFNNSLALIDDLDLESEIGGPIDETEREDEDDGTGEEGVDTASNSGDDALDEGMFDLDLGASNTSPPPQASTTGAGGMDLDASSTTSGPGSDRSRSVGRDSGFGSLEANKGASLLSPPSTRGHALPPTMGFFKPQNSGTFVR
ncbi:hypothetical protein OIV83_003513 [Microbotryomycetes sp. JL201]|nr:hypothetical protein OIV83_003513 [Microbotryomycetes sp. JL201]